MAIYTMSQTVIKRQARLVKKMKWWMFGVSATGLAISLLLIFDSTGWFASHITMSGEKRNLILLIFLVILVQSINPWGRLFKAAGESVRQFSVEMTSEDVQVKSGIYSRSLRRSEIVQAEESSLGRGLFLRTSNRYRWILIPRQIDGYEDIKDSLVASQNLIVKAKILPNWEEYLFILLACGSILCDIATRNRIILFGNLAVAALVGIAGLILANNFHDNRAMMVRVRLGSLIPAAGALLALLFPFGLS